MPSTGDPPALKPARLPPAHQVAGTVPFSAYALSLLIPTGEIIVQAFRNPSGRFTFANVRGLFDAQILRCLRDHHQDQPYHRRRSAAYSGLLVAQAALRDGGPLWIRPVLTTFAGVASNFAGIPLAFAFVATLGSTGRDHGAAELAGPAYLQSRIHHLRTGRPVA